MTALVAIAAYLVVATGAAFAVGRALRRLGDYPSPDPTRKEDRR